MFGEWIFSHPESDRSVEFANDSGMTILDFGLCIAIRSALAEKVEAGAVRNDFLAGGGAQGGHPIRAAAPGVDEVLAQAAGW